MHKCTKINYPLFGNFLKTTVLAWCLHYLYCTKNVQWNLPKPNYTRTNCWSEKRCLVYTGQINKNLQFGLYM